jgi:plasmid stabilization system protein ParE
MIDPEFEYHAAAIAEAWEAYHWYDERSEMSADRFWQALRRARLSVIRHPRAWTPYVHGTRCYQLEGFPYALVYVEKDDRIIGIAVAHLKRQPGYWRERLVD